MTKFVSFFALLMSTFTAVTASAKLQQTLWLDISTCSIFTTHTGVDKAPRLSISIVIWILSSDTICQLNQFNTNSEAAMLSTGKLFRK